MPYISVALIRSKDVYGPMQQRRQNKILEIIIGVTTWDSRWSEDTNILVCALRVTLFGWLMVLLNGLFLISGQEYLTSVLSGRVTHPWLSQIVENPFTQLNSIVSFKPTRND